MWTVLSMHRAEIERVNRRGIEAVGAKVRQLGADDGHAVFLGDVAVLMGLYQSLAAFPSRVWAVGLRNCESDEESVTEQAVKTLPDNVRFGRLGRIETVGGPFLKEVEVGDFRFRIPSEELLVAFLAARVGEPEASLESPTWAHLMIAVTAMGSRFDFDTVRKLARELGCEERIHRGFAIARMFSDEIAEMIPAKELVIPLWERMALRIAASRMLREAVESERPDEFAGSLEPRAVAV